jgi:hypothetical protein
MGGRALARRCGDRRADVRVSADAGLTPASSRRSYAPSGDDREWFDRPLRSVKPGQCMPVVNAPSARRVILRMMRRERYRGSQVRGDADEPLSVVVHRSAMFADCARCQALWAPTGCALHRAGELEVLAVQQLNLDGRSAIGPIVAQTGRRRLPENSVSGASPGPIEGLDLRMPCFRNSCAT